MNGFEWGEISPRKKKTTSVAPPEIATRTRLIYGALDVLCWRWPQLFFGTKKCPSKILGKKNTMMFLVCFKQKYCSNSFGCFFKEKYWSTFHRNFIDLFVLDFVFHCEVFLCENHA